MIRAVCNLILALIFAMLLFLVVVAFGLDMLARGIAR